MGEDELVTDFGEIWKEFLKARNKERKVLSVKILKTPGCGIMGDGKLPAQERGAPACQ